MSEDPRPQGPERLVLDTNVSLDLFVFADERWSPLRGALEQGRCEAVIDASCRTEFIRVLGYRQLSLSPREQARAIEALDALYWHVDGPEAGPATLPRCADPDDQKFLELALASRADAVLSKDKAVLELSGRLRRMGLFQALHPQEWVAVHAGMRHPGV